jgi:hypothetical protein
MLVVSVADVSIVDVSIVADWSAAGGETPADDEQLATARASAAGSSSDTARRTGFESCVLVRGASRCLMD